MVKWPKKRVLAFLTQIIAFSKNNDPAYHVGNFPTKFLKKKVFRKIGFDVIMTSQSPDFWLFS